MSAHSQGSPPGDGSGSDDRTETIQPPGRKAAAPRAGDPDLPAGEVIGHFRIDHPLGSGGAGAVFVAEDVDIPGRRVAVKLIKRGGLTPNLEALRREASALAALHHPNILVVHEIGSSRHGPYMVTELMEQGSLADRLREGVLPLPELLRIGRAIADAIRAAHAHGILHRDIKPANILMGEDGSPKVADFGLAWKSPVATRDLSRSKPADPSTVQEASTDSDPNAGLPSAAGTPPYLAPEILEGGPPTPASDQFALGVTLHELLTGRRPYHGAHVSASILSGRPEISPLVPRDLAALISRAIARDPAARYRDLEAVVTALDHARERRDPRRRRLTWVIAASIGVLMASVAVWTWLRFQRGVEARALNEQGRLALERGDRDGARKAFLEAHGVDHGYLPACTNLGYLAALESNPTWALTILDECAETFPGSDVARYNLGTTLRLLGQKDRAEKELRKSLALAGAGAIRPLVLNDLALLLVEQHRGAEATALLAGEGKGPLKPPLPDAATVEGAILQKTLGLAYLDAGDPAGAAAALRRGLAGPLPAAQRASALASLGRALEAAHDPMGATEAYSRALLAGPDPDTEKSAHDGLARLQEAEARPPAR